MVSPRLRAWALALGSSMLMAIGPGETDVEVQLTGTAGRYARPCGGYQDLGSARVYAQLEGELPGESEHALQVEGWVESGPTRDAGATPRNPTPDSWYGVGAGSMSMGYTRRWGELSTGVVVVGGEQLSIQAVPTARLRLGPEQRVFWTAQLAPDLRATLDYVLRSDLHVRLMVPPEVWLSAGGTLAGHQVPQPVLGVRYLGPRGLGVQSSFAMAADDRDWWFFSAGVIFRGTVDR